MLFQNRKICFKYIFLVKFSLLVLLSVSGCKQDPEEVQHKVEDWEKRGEELFYFGFPFVKNYSWMAESIYNPENLRQTEWNTFLHFDPDDNNKNFSHINPDVVHSVAYVDLRNGPIELIIPHIRDRYASVQVFEINADNFLTLRSNESITRQRKYVLAPKHNVPPCDADVEGLYISESPILVIIARVSNLKTKGLPQVRDLLSKFKIAPFDNTSYTLGEPLYYDHDFHLRPESIYDTEVFLTWLRHALKDYDFRLEEKKYEQYLREMGFWQADFDYCAVPEAVRSALNKGFKAGYQRWIAGVNYGQTEVPGWFYGNRNVAYNGENTFEKALSSSSGIPGVVEAKSSYVRAYNDNKMKVLHADYTYKLHFAPQALPPVRSFWSITAYSDTGESKIQGDVKSWINSAKDKLHYHDDGSLTIYISREDQRRVEYENWLEIPTKDRFNLILRMYDVSEFVNGSHYQAPKIERFHTL